MNILLLVIPPAAVLLMITVIGIPVTGIDLDYGVVLGNF